MRATLAGAIGTLSRRIAKATPKSLAQQLGLPDALKGSPTLYYCLVKYKDILVKVGFVKEEDLFFENLDDGVLVKVGSHCTYINACTALNDEGVHDVFGSIVCIRILALAGIAEAALDKTFDVSIENYSPPNCEGKIFEVF